jgi:hypothetical protein
MQNDCVNQALKLQSCIVCCLDRNAIPVNGILIQLKLFHEKKEID